MAKKDPPAPQRVELRKYPNRRYYDSAQSRHVTLEEIYGMILAGSEVHVTDSKTGEDITAKVLGQIILEHDPLKLGIFPAELLHQLIRANEPLVRDFMDKYFCQAFSIFVESQRQFDRYLRQALGLRTPLATGQDWARMMMGPLAPMFYPTGNAKNAPSDAQAAAPRPAPDGPGEEDLRGTIHDLEQQVAELRQELERQQGRSSLK